MRRMKTTLLGVAASLALLASVACGDGEDSSDTTPTATAGRGGGQSQAASPAGSGTPVVLENATTTASGLKYVDEVVGTGASPRPDQQVTVHYTGRLAANGQKFDSSVDGGQPITFPMNNVIPGFAEGLSTMKVGGKRTVYIPAALGYGNRALQGIPANSDLIFDIELIAIK